MRTVETFQSRRNWLGIRVVAEAQAIPAAGMAPAPTEHVYAWTYGPLSGWTERGDELVRQVLNQALDMLAGSIASTYMGSWESMIFAAETAAANRHLQEMASSNARKVITPSSVAIAPAMDSSLPVAGDSWSYKLSESKGATGKSAPTE